MSAASDDDAGQDKDKKDWQEEDEENLKAKNGLHNLTNSDLAVKTIKIILFFFNLRYLTSRKRLTIEAYPCETATIINCHLCIKIPITFNSNLGLTIQAARAKAPSTNATGTTKMLMTAVHLRQVVPVQV